jgi:hypothetical protein
MCPHCKSSGVTGSPTPVAGAGTVILIKCSSCQAILGAVNKP